MDEPNNPLDPVNLKPVDEDLRDELQAARGVVSLLLISMTCIAAAVSLYLYRQVVNLNRQVVDARRVVTEFQSNSLPKIAWFVENLQAFSKTNPDFVPILGKYNVLPPATPVSAPAPASGKPAQGATPKK